MPIFRMPREEAVQARRRDRGLLARSRHSRRPVRRPSPAAADPAEGQRLYVSLGCRGCHIVGTSGGYYGPPLTDTSTRLKPGWIYTWLKGPQRWRADVRCPGLRPARRRMRSRLTAYLETQKAPAQAKAAGGGK